MRIIIIDDDGYLWDHSEANSYSCNRVRNRFLSVKQKDFFHDNGGGGNVFEHGGDGTSGGVDGCSGLGDYFVVVKLRVVLGVLMIVVVFVMAEIMMTYILKVKKSADSTFQSQRICGKSDKSA